MWLLLKGSSRKQDVYIYIYIGRIDMLLSGFIIVVYFYLRCSALSCEFSMLNVLYSSGSDSRNDFLKKHFKTCCIKHCVAPMSIPPWHLVWLISTTLCMVFWGISTAGKCEWISTISVVICIQVLVWLYFGSWIVWIQWKSSMTAMINCFSCRFEYIFVKRNSCDWKTLHGIENTLSL